MHASSLPVTDHGEQRESAMAQHPIEIKKILIISMHRHC
ncbi:hypothetical protein GMOD_00003900 [Pyrenophora seminiperda CCB06]|uniref:Uncharacterized protein n=1 Tax=Pyrenophora seminiperda CCB06 TaxID=1302712 RepID=A0A3M7M079_9PLEO|nr:hypothetical protein GMOD_00003900 [Pyrenophora seminiperda CCB06]